MENMVAFELAFLMFGIAMLYASVGHAGGSGYLAVMGLWGLSQPVMKPSALVLNLIVATIGSIKFYRAGYFSWQVFTPFALTSVPFAFIGSSLRLTNHVYEILVGFVLFYAAYRLTVQPPTSQPMPFSTRWALVAGLVIGLLAGMTGTGGGIFLTPLLLFTGWAEPRQASAVSVVFIWVNSLAGLLGDWSKLQNIPASFPLWAMAVLVGGWVGAHYGSQHGRSQRIRQLLVIVMLFAAFKLVFL
jgi:hypothetical protein